MKKNQKVWYINNTWDTLEEGILISTKNKSGYDEHPTLSIRGKYGISRILKDWIFSTEAKGKNGLEKKIQQDIQRIKAEIVSLERKLSKLW